MYSTGYGSGYEFLELFTGGLIVFLILFCILVIAAGVFQIVCQWKVYQKAGKEGWEAIVPIYNSWVLFEISGYPGWIALFAIGCCVPFVNFLIAIGLCVMEVIAALSLAEKFGKEKVFGLLLAFVPIVGYAILAFGNAEYDETRGNQLNKASASNSTNNTNKVFCSSCGTGVDKGVKFCPKCGEKI